MTIADKNGLLSREHFSVDGTLVQAWASRKSSVRKDGKNEPPQGRPRNAQSDGKGMKRPGAGPPVNGRLSGISAGARIILLRTLLR